MSDEHTMPEVIYASDSSCDMMYGKWWRSKELDHYQAYLRCDIDPDDAVVVSKQLCEDIGDDQRDTESTIATLTAEREKVRELVEAVLKERDLQAQSNGYISYAIEDVYELAQTLAAQLREQDDA